MDYEHGAARIQQIVEQSHRVARCLFSGQAQDWLNVDLTMPQLKTLLCVAQAGDATSGQIARGLGVSLSTVTGIVDRLTEQGLVSRREDPGDRRITRVLPTDSGRELVRRLLRYRDERLTSLLASLSPDELATVEHAFEHLASAATRLDEFAAPVGA
jgi:DNA-binding MarR family transcriptional regulator